MVGRPTELSWGYSEEPVSELLSCLPFCNLKSASNALEFVQPAPHVLPFLREGEYIPTDGYALDVFFSSGGCEICGQSVCHAVMVLHWGSPVTKLVMSAYV